MKKRFIIPILIIVIIISIALWQYIKIKKYKDSTELVDGQYTQEQLDDINRQVGDYLSDKIVPEGLSYLTFQYSGENDLNDFYKGIYSFANYIPKLSKKIKGKNQEYIEEYYQKNKAEITENSGITKQSEFIKLTNYLNQEQEEIKKIQSVKIEKDSCENGKKYFTCDISFKYLNQELKFKAYIYNQTTYANEIFKFETIDQ